MNTARLTLLLLAAVLAGLVAWGVARGTPPDALRIATWNMEWLVSPETAHAARLACREGRRTGLPCDVARSARDSADLWRLAGYARELDADIVAFQEVENGDIAARVFRGYRLCIARGAGTQHVGFAWREHVPARCGSQLATLQAGGRGRPGLVLQVNAAGLPSFELLAVHLKSGCSREPIDAPDASCRLLSEQGRVLGDWIARRATSGAPFIVLGDFNRAGPARSDPFWQRLHPEAFTAVTGSIAFRNCVFGQPYSTFIDHVLVGHALRPHLDLAASQRLVFRAADAARYRLPDHCPIRVSLNPRAVL